MKKVRQNPYALADRIPARGPSPPLRGISASSDYADMVMSGNLTKMWDSVSRYWREAAVRNRHPNGRFGHFDGREPKVRFETTRVETPSLFRDLEGF